MRSSWKVPFISKTFFQNRFLTKLARRKKIHIRTSLIPSKFIDRKIRIHNGSQYISIRVSSNMMGFRFGSFAHSKIVVQYTHIKRKSKRKTKH